MTFAGWADGGAQGRDAAVAGRRDHRRDAARGHARQGARRVPAHHRRPAGGAGRLVPRPLDAELAGKADAAAVLAKWDGTRRPRRRARDRAGAAGCATRRWIPATRNALENVGRTLRARTRDVVGEWAALLTDRAALGAGFARHAPGAVHRRAARRRAPLVRRRAIGCARAAATRTTTSVRARRRGRGAAAAHLPAPARPAARRRKGVARLRAPDGRRGAGLLAARAGGAAGHDVRASARSRWPATPRRRSRPSTASRAGPSCSTSWTSRTSASSRCASATARRARSSTCAEHVLGPLQGDVRPVAPRAGAPVESFAFASAGECARVPVARAQGAGARRAGGVGRAARPPPRAGAGRTTRRCTRAEVPTLRLVADQDFSFVAGIDVTDVRQSKGLEFDIVILLDVNDASYPATTTRAACCTWR